MVPKSLPDSKGFSEVPRSIGRVLDLLEIVLSDEGCNLSSAAARSELTPTTALRHLRALEARGYVSREADGLYSAGPVMCRIAARLRDGGLVERVIHASQPYLDELAAETGESAYLAVGDQTTATYIATAEGTHSIRHVGWVGQNVTLKGTAVGAALADPGKVEIRSGAVEPDITALSLALEPMGPLCLAISVVGPASRMVETQRKRVHEGLLKVSSALCRDLGLKEQVAS